MRFCYYIHILLVFCIVEVFSGWGANNSYLDFLDVAPAGWVRTDIYSQHGTHFIQFQKQGNLYGPFKIQINIKFPKKGKQPTTAEAALWSCANINDDAVTEWYMRMFGWTAPEENEKKPLEMGFGIADNGKKLISAPIIHAYDKGDDLEEQEEIMTFELQNIFWQTFRQIASNPVGRVLLYRLLIEIRRVDKNGNECIERQYTHLRKPDKRQLFYRKTNLSIYITSLIKDDWTYFTGKIWQGKARQARIMCYFLEEREPMTLVHGIWPNFYTEDAVESDSENDFSIYNQTRLFHEMLHWYQQLRDPVRVTRETAIAHPYSAFHLIQHFYGSPPSTNQNQLMPYLSWIINPRLEGDEFRVICGDRPDRSQTYLEEDAFLEGDDLSENALRCSLDAHMRFGHGEAIAFPMSYSALFVAYKTALSCVKNITGQTLPWENWILK